MAIEESITVEAPGAAAEVNAIADAFERAAGAYGKLREELAGGLDMGAAGPDKLAASWKSGLSGIGASVDKFVAETNAKLATLGADAGKGLADLAGKLDAAAGSASGAADKIGASGAKLDELGASAGSAAGKVGGLGDAVKGLGESADGLAGSGAGASDSIKGIGDSADKSAGQLAALKAEMAETAAANDKTMASIAAGQDAVSAKIASAQRLNSAQMKMASDEAVAAQSAQANAAKQAAADAEAASSKHSTAVLGLAAALGYGVYKAGQLQTQVTRLYTSAGESQANLPADTQAILRLSGQTDTSQAALGKAAYTVNSANFHGANMAAVLRSAAQGAQAEGADPGLVANALTTTLNDYFGGPAKTPQLQQQQATSAMNAIIASVGQGKMTLQDLSTALPVVLPVGKQAGLSLAQILGAESTMTGQGMSAQWSANDIRHTIGALQKPSNVQAAEMQMLGIDPNQLSKDLGKQGLTGTIAEVDQAIQSHMGPGGMVLLDTMNQSKLAVQSAKEEIAAMPPALRQTAQAYLDGSISAKTWNKEMFSGSESARDKNLLQQFSGTANLAHGFSTLVKSGLGNKQTEAAALNAMMGGQVGQQTALMLGGSHLKTFGDNVKTVGDQAKTSGDNIRGWSDVQKNLNFQLGSFIKTTEAVATEAGQVALPAVTSVLKVASGVGGFLASNPEITKPLMVGGGVLAAGYALQKVSAPVTTALQGVGKIAQTLHIPGLDKLANVGSSSGLGGAAAGLQTAGTGLQAAAGDLSAAAGKLELGGGIPGGGPAGTAAKAEGEAAAAAEEGGAAGLGAGWLGKFKATGAKALGRAMAGATIAYMGNELANALPSGAQQAKAPIRVASDMAGGAIAGSTFGPIGTAIGAGIGLWAGLGENTNLARYPNKYATGAYVPGGGANAAFGKTGPLISGPSAIQTERTPPPPPPPPPLPAAPTTLPSYRTTAGLRGTAGAVPDIKAKVDVDLTTLNAAKTKAMSALAGISSAKVQPVKVPEPDLSGVNSAKTKAQNALQQIASAKVQPVKIPEPDTSRVDAAKTKVISTLASMRGPATAAGAGAGAGLAAGILSETGAVVAAADQVAAAGAAALRTALQTHSPSKVTWPVGEDFTAGFAGGIHSAKSKAKTKAATMSIAASTVTSLTQGLQGGQSAIDAAFTALTGKDARPQDIQQINATVSTLMGDLSTAMSKKIIGKKEDSALVAMLKADQGKLDTLAGKRAQLITEIDTAQQTATSVVSGASIMNAANAQPTQSITPQASSLTVQGMQDQAQQAALYAKQLRQLKKEGLNATELDQLAQAGPSAGLGITQGLVGDKGAIGQLNAAQKQITQAAGAIGDVAGPAAYQSGQQITAATAKGLKSQLAAVEATMKQLATGMVNSVKTAVSGGGLAASMKAAGAAAGQSFAAGIISAEGGVVGATQQLVQAAVNAAKNQSHAKPPPHHHGSPQPDWGLPGGGMLLGGMAPSGGRGGGTETINVTVHVTVDPANMSGVIQSVSLEHASRNWQQGYNYPYKAA